MALLAVFVCAICLIDVSAPSGGVVCVFLHCVCVLLHVVVKYVCDVSQQATVRIVSWHLWSHGLSIMPADDC